MKKRRLAVRFNHHAMYRLTQRSRKFNIPEDESKRRVIRAIKEGRQAKRHRSRNHVTYCMYFSDNTAYYAVCRIYRDYEQTIVFVKTVIIKRGRP